MERREKNLNEELKEYIQKANNVCKLGGFVSYEDKIIDPFDSIPDELKKEYEYIFSQIHEHVRSQSQWNNEINQAYKEAQDEILDYVQQKHNLKIWLIIYDKQWGELHKLIDL